LFDLDDEEMLTCKFGNWWEENPQRGRANNSAVVLRHKIDEEEFFKLWKKIELSNSGEPGIYFSNDKDWGTNPCCEIALRSYQFCNLCEINASNVESQEDLNERVKVASFIGTLQASYTNFHYLRDIWQKTTEKDALLGVGMTGIGSGAVLKYNLKEAADVAKEENERVAELIGINKAARVTTVKPSGTSSLVLGTSSGIHAWHNDYYIRRIRVGKNEAIYSYLAINHPELVEDDFFKPTIQAVISVPQKAPEGSILRTENVIDMLERVKKFNTQWVKKGHRKGANTNNVSATVSIKEGEWEEVGKWMWENKETFNGLSVLPYFGGTYTQAPFEDITKEQFEEMVTHLHGIDLTKVVEFSDETALMDQAACSGGACEIV
jgi:ribonucleoside-diphosphate reductase alpha chain